MRMLHAALAAALLFLAACAEPLPETRASYIGDWVGRDMRLVITAEGQVRYERRTGRGSKSINAPLQGFDGDDFVVGIGPFTTTFEVSQPPRVVDGAWKMTVDGVELTRRGGVPADDRTA